ncbi:sugar ABC transporter ATP-binding protein [Blautia schinkii]|nr:sugar ABC transporter ATP-binding protein [Blautia schinkii]
MDNQNNIIEMNHIVKKFSDNVVLNNVSFHLRKGEVHSLMGANGAGKSTLIKILNGLYNYDEGEILYNGKQAEINKVEDAEKLGIAFVHQELNICPDLSVAENIFVGNLRKNKWGVFDKAQTIKEAQDLIDMVQVDMKATDIVRNLRAAEKQIIEILKALTMDAGILVLDEPTSSLNEKEKEIFIGIVNRLKAQGVSIIFISHFIEDVLLLSDRITVLKDGVNNGVFEAGQITKDELITAMMGKKAEVRKRNSEKLAKDTPVVMELKNLSSEYKFENIDLKIQKGSIIGVCGLLGAGKTEIARAIMGIDKFDSGEILLDGEKIHKVTPEIMMKKQVAIVTEDRKTEGFVPMMSIRENSSLSIMKNFANKLGILDFDKQKNYADELSRKMTVKMSSVEQEVGSLSGGNQQKVIIGRCVASNPKVFLLDEPTRGVDVLAKSEIYKILLEMAAKGVAVLIFSSELEELLEVCDEIVILKKGKIVGRVSTEELDKNTLMAKIS